MIKQSAIHLAKASDGNPVISTVTVMLFYIAFNVLEAAVETLLFGDGFLHWLDPIFQLSFIAYAAYGVYACSKYQGAKISAALSQEDK